MFPGSNLAILTPHILNLELKLYLIPKNTKSKFGHLILRKTALHKSEFVIYSERYISTANGNLSRIKFLYRTMKSVLC